MNLRLIVDWHGWREGKVFTGYHPGAGRLLISRGIAVEVAEPEADSPTTDFGSLTQLQLREACRDRGLPIYGAKAALIERLLQS